MKKTPRILVVDDNPAILQIYSQMLRTEGYEVCEASTGLEGLQATREKHPDVVLVDVVLPDLSGIEVCRQIKTDAALSGILVVLVSGDATSVAQKVEGLDTGADDYLVKPVAPDEFRARIRTIVRLGDTTAALRASEQQYRKLIEILPDAACVIDLQGRLTAVNQRGVQMMGYPNQEELLEKSVFDLVLSEDHARLRADIARTLETGAVRNATHTLLHKGGARLAVELSASALTDATNRPVGIIVVGRDITERKHTEEKLRQLSRAVEQSPATIVITDPAGNIEYVNPKFVEITGYALAEVVGRNPRILKSGATSPEAYQGLWQTITAGKEWHGEFHNKKKNGELYWESASISPIRDLAGCITHFVAVKEDITERKRTGEALRESEERFRKLYETMIDSYVNVDMSGKIIEFNDAFRNLVGYSDDEIRSLACVDITPQEWHPAEAKIIEEQVLKRGYSDIYEKEYRRKDDTLVRVELRTCLRRDDSGRPVGMWAIVRDITERKRADEALRKAEARYRSIFDNATEGIFQSTPKGQIIGANPALARMFGYESPEEMISSVTDIDRQIYVSPERRRELKHILDTKGSVLGFEAENYRRDGNTIWIQVNGHTVRDASGAVLHYEGTVQDITQRKWAEDLLQVERDFGLFLSSTNDMKAILERLLAITIQKSDADYGVMHLVDAKTGALELAAQHGLPARFAKKVSHFPADRQPGHAPDAGPGIFPPHGKPLAALVRQLERDGWRAMEVIPIQYSGRVVAVLSLGSHSCREMPARCRHLIDSISGSTGGAIARIRAEQSLYANRQMLEKTLNSIRAAVFLLDAKTGVVQDCNAAAAHMFGYTRDEMVGHTPEFLHPTKVVLEQLSRNVPLGSQDKGLKDEFELQMKRKDGRLFPAEHTLSAIKDEAGRLVGWVNVVRDITGRRQVEAELRQLPQRIIEAQEAERLRVARDLHDGVNQLIASAKMRLRKVDDLVEGLNPAASEILARCDRLLVQSLEENRRIAHNLRPSDLDELGLDSACRNFCKEIQSRTNLAVESRIMRLSRRLPPAVELNLFRIVQEALNNVEKHARAKTVRLKLAFQNGSLVLRIQDDGRGFAPKAVKAGQGQTGGIGLTNMRERAASLGGTCQVKSALKQGTVITVRVPGLSAR